VQQSEMMKKDLLTLKDLSADEIMGLIDGGLKIKNAGRDTDWPLKGYTLGLIFDKSSTRTRVSFETAMFRLGGETLFLSRQDTQLSRNEALKDTARVLSRYLDALVIRTFSQEIIEEMARFADIPVINALTDQFHPCQILSDLMTIKEKRGDLQNMKVAWIGDGNNVANSWINAASILGFELALACPEGYTPNAEILEKAGENVSLETEPKNAAEGADVINTDVWASMGQEGERDQRIKDFKGFQVNPSLVDLGKPNVLIMHCLPAHRGEEVTAEVLEGPHSIIFDQAENKMHLHQALLEKMLVKR
jgi:ornithine carbamoyltransferase